MQVQLAPARPPDRRTGLVTTLAVMAPVVTLVLVAGFAWGGTDGGGVPERRDGAVSPSDAPAQRARVPAPTPGIHAADPGITLPRAFGITVRTIDELLAERSVGHVGGELVAVSGYLWRGPREHHCIRLRDATPNTFCRRVLTLMPDTRRHQISPRRHLHVQALPGTPLPELAAPLLGDEALVARPEPVLVIILGRFDDPRTAPCMGGSSHCHEEFVIERIAWAAGEIVPAPFARDPIVPDGTDGSSGRTLRVLALQRPDWGRPLLSEALVGVDLLERFDPVAAAAVTRDVTGPVWYRRTIDPPTETGGPYAVRWVVVDPRSGMAIASGSVGRRVSSIRFDGPAAGG